MDKYEYRIKAEQIVKLVGKRDYTKAVEIADEIDWNRVKNVQMLCTVSDVYEKNEKYEEAREILFLAYDRSPADRMIVYKIVELSLAVGDLKEAVNYFREYTQLAPNDTNIYILKYKLYVANNANIETLISVLEEFKEQDFHEEWGLELAKLYAQGGYIEQCVELCDEIDLWFNEGPYVMQALELKQQFEVLTQAQQEKLDQGYAMMHEAENLKKMVEQNPQEEQINSTDDEDIFFAGNKDAAFQKENSENDESEILADEDEETYELKDASQLEDDLAEMEYYPDDMSDEDEDNIEEESKEKSHSGSVFARLGKLGKFLVEPVSDFDMEDENYDEPDEQENYEDVQNAQADEEPVDGTEQIIHDESEDETEPIDDKSDEEPESENDYKETEKSKDGFDLSRLAAVQEAYEENYEKEDPDIIEEPEDKEEPEQEISNQNISEESVAEQQNEEPLLSKHDTKPFDRRVIKKKIDKAQYEKNIEGALRKLDKVVNGKMDEDEFREEIQSTNLDEENEEAESTLLDKQKIENQMSDDLNRTQDEAVSVWNGVSRYDTMNLQKELAKSIQKLLDATEMDDVDSTLEDVKKLVEDSNIPELTETMRFRTIKAGMLNDWAKNQAERLNKEPDIEISIEHKRNNIKHDKPVEHKRKFPYRKTEVEVIPSIKLKPTKEDRKRKLEQILVQEDDGQIGLIMPQEEMVEKQITGQLNIEDILKEWDRQKNDEENQREKKKLEEARKKALTETREFMSQVMDLLAQCLPKCAESDSPSLALSIQLNKVRQALNSTQDLSEISKLNAELADILDKICPLPQIKEVTETGAMEESAEESDSQEEIQEQPEETASEEIEEAEESVPEIIEEPVEESVPEEIEKPAVDDVFEAEAEKEPEEKNSQEQIESILEEEIEEVTQESAPEEEIEEVTWESAPKEEIEEATQESAPEEETEEVIQESAPEIEPEDEEEPDSEEDINKMMEEALARIAFDIQETAQEDYDMSEEDEADAMTAAGVMPEDDDAADDIEDNIEDNLPESAEALSDSEEQVDLFETDENTFIEGDVEDNEDEGSVLPKGSVSSLLSSDYNGESGLTEKQKEAFSYFASIEEVATQLNQILNVEKKGNQNMIITGGDGAGKTSLAIRIAKAEELEGNSSAKKVAKIKAATLNSYDMEEVYTTVGDGVLVIEKAVALADSTMAKLNDKLNKGAKFQIILTTKSKSVERLRSRNPEFMSRFNVLIDMPTYSNNELVEYGKVYARANGYEIEDMAVLALFSRLGTLQGSRGGISFGDVKEVIDEAIAKSRKRKKRFFKKLLGKKNDNGIYLQEEDFE